MGYLDNFYNTPHAICSQFSGYGRRFLTVKSYLLFLLSILLLASMLFIGCTLEEPPVGIFSDTTISSHGGPLILVHYMPWYRGPSNKSQETNKNSYGGHWTRWGYYNPSQHDPNGRAYIHSKHYPLTGPYHSSNAALLEYQASLMIIAGIDGVIFDWYGAYEANDFGENQGYTTEMVSVLKRAELFYSICYEDNTLNMMDGMNPAPVTENSLDIGKYSFDWAQTNWFAYDEFYVRYEGRPVVLCFGPQHFKTKEQWDYVFYSVNPKPLFVDLDNHYSLSDSSFPWPPMWASGDGVLTQTRLTQYLDDFYKQKRNQLYKTASAFSAFEDDYATSYGLLAYDDGKVFDLTWKKAIAFNPHIIQIVTWNDYGEGTIIEPTIERGYNELEYIQDRIKEYNPDFPFSKLDFTFQILSLYPTWIILIADRNTVITMLLFRFT